MTPIIELALARVNQSPTGCWSFNGYHNKSGYATIENKRGTRLVHRLMYEHFIGPVPEGLVLDHEKCDNRSCVNPHHLVAKTNVENVMRSNEKRMVAHRNGTCTNGHDITGDNGYRRPGNGKVVCRLCRAAYERSYREKGRRRNRKH